MERTVEEIENEIGSADEEEGVDEEMGRARRKKKRTHIVSSDEEPGYTNGTQSVHMPTQKVPSKKLKKQLHEKQ